MFSTLQWELLECSAASPEENMSKDTELLEGLAHSPHPILHLYGWDRPSATYGHFVDPLTLLDAKGVDAQGLALAKRPTGGGIIFHLCDLAFSVLLPSCHPRFSLNTLENYAFVNQKVIQALRCFNTVLDLPQLLPKEPEPLDASCRHFCMAKPTRYDVMLGGKKVGGAAQRRKRWGYLHQGTISLAPLPLSFLRAVLLGESRVLEAMQLNSYALIDATPHSQALEEARDLLRNALKTVLLE